MTNDQTPSSQTNGVRFIDANRECLLFLTKRFFDPAVVCMEGQTSCPRLEDTLRFIERNFEREEYLIRASGYAALEEHHEDHQVLIKKIRDIKEKYQCSKYKNSSVVDEINKWLVRHTDEFDHDFVRFWQEQSKAAQI